MTTTTTTTPPPPKAIKAAYFAKNGDAAQVVSVRNDMPMPQPVKGEILVKVAAASINPVDWKLVRGDLPGASQGTMGFDVCGTVVEIGPDTETNLLQVGDVIYADTAPHRGTFATHARVPVVAAHKIPSNLDAAAAASLPLAGLTALQGLVTQGGVRENHNAPQKVCILGGSGGVGALAVQMAKKALGASTVVATGSAVEMIQKLGADKVVNYKQESIVDALKGQEFDVIFDTIGGIDGWMAALQGGLKKGGTYVTIVGDGQGTLSSLFNWAWRYTKSLFGLCPAYKFFLTNTKAPSVQADMAKLTEWLESGKVKPVLDGRTFTLTTESVREMIQVSMSHRAKGKLILKVDC